MGSAYQFHSWRVFVVVCALPCVCAVVALTFMPESPRFYLEVMFFPPKYYSSRNVHTETVLISLESLKLPNGAVSFSPTVCTYQFHI